MSDFQGFGLEKEERKSDGAIWREIKENEVEGIHSVK